MRRMKILASIIGILILIGSVPIISASNIIGNSTIKSSTGGSTPLTYGPPVVVEGKNLALYDNGGRINLDKCRFMDKDDLKNNLCIDGDKYTGVDDDHNQIYWGKTPYAQIEIDLAGEDHKLYSIEVVFDIDYPNNCEKLSIQVYKTNGKDEWVTVLDDYGLTGFRTARAFGVLLEDDKGEVYQISKIRIRLYTSLYAKHCGYYHSDFFSINEIRAYEAVYDYEPPEITFTQPNPDIPELWAPIPMVFNIAIPWIDLRPFGIDYSIMINCPLIVSLKDDAGIKHYSIAKDGEAILDKEFTADDKISVITITQALSEKTHEYSIYVEDFAGRVAENHVKILANSNGNACVLSAPIGPDSSKTKESNTYSVTTLDVENDPIEVGWDWNGDGSVDQWTSSNSASHSWSKPGEYNIIVSVREANSGRLGLWTVSKTINIEKDGSSPSADLSQSSAITTSVTSTTTTTTSTSSETSSISASTSGTILKTNTLLR